MKKYRFIKLDKIPVWVLLILFGFYGHMAYGQSCVEDYLSVPTEFQGYCKTSFIEDINRGRKSLEGLDYSGDNCWDVYSDRSHNPYFDRVEGQIAEGYLEYMAKVRVKEVRGSWLLVYSLGTGRKNNPDKKLGWIKADKVLLSSFALLNEKSIPRKAMILVSLANLDQEQLVSGDILQNKFYYHPSAETRNFSGNSAKRMEIYFIVKEVDGAVLLSKADKLKGSKQDVLVAVPGWIPTGNVTFWDHRVCLEPAYKPDAVRAYKDKSIPVFDQKEQVEAMKASQFYDKRNVIKRYEIKPQRPSSYNIRMPILNNYDSEVKKVACIARLDSAADNDIADITEKIQKLKMKVNNVNILFVVDATQSMEPYFEPVARSIENIIAANKRKKSLNNLKFGLVIYRDYKDGPKAVEVTPLTNTASTIIDKLNTTQCFSNNDRLPEAQYNGLVKGIDQAGFGKAQSNIVVLIGDAGNHEDDRNHTAKEVVDKLFKYQCNLVAFQVKYGVHDTYDVFNEDAQDYLRNTAKKYIKGGNAQVSLDKADIKNSYKLNFLTQSNQATDLYMFGRFTYASYDNKMDGLILESNVEKLITEYIEKVNELQAMLENASGGNESFTPEFIDLLRRKGFTIKEIEVLRKLKEITAEGNTATNFYAKTPACFVPVVFLSSTEKEGINKILSKLVYGIAGHQKKRKLFKEALLAQCMQMLGEVSQDNILDKTLTEIWDIMLAVPFEKQNSGIDKIKLRDLDKGNVFSDEKFNDFYSSFEQSAKRFISNDYRSSKFKLANTTYYWIPLNEIPGNE